MTSAPPCYLRTAHHDGATQFLPLCSASSTLADEGLARTPTAGFPVNTTSIRTSARDCRDAVGRSSRLGCPGRSGSPRTPDPGRVASLAVGLSVAATRPGSAHAGRSRRSCHLRSWPWGARMLALRVKQSVAREEGGERRCLLLVKGLGRKSHGGGGRDLKNPEVA